MYYLNLFQVFSNMNNLSVKDYLPRNKIQNRKSKLAKKTFEKHDCNSQTITYN